MRDCSRSDDTRRRLLVTVEDPPPFENVNPDGSTSLLLICDHASSRIPASLDHLGLSRDSLSGHVVIDIGAAEVTRGLAYCLDCPAVLSGYSRLVIDCNRWVDDPRSILDVSAGVTIPGNQGLTGVDRTQRAMELFWPYHDAIAAARMKLWAKGTPPVLASIHSFTPSLDGRPRPWDVGIFWHWDRRFAKAMLDGLRKVPGLVVGDNQPYTATTGAFSTDYHGEAFGLANGGIEIRQDHLANPAGIAKWIDILSNVLGPVINQSQIDQIDSP